ncbi:MAG: hypothetical protein R2795_13720 [Saprospiraceae bacterium]
MATSLAAQEKGYDQLTLKSGKTITGTLVSYDVNDRVVFRNDETDVVSSYLIEAVEKLVQQPIEGDISPTVPSIVTSTRKATVTQTNGKQVVGIIKALDTRSSLSIVQMDGKATMIPFNDIFSIRLERKPKRKQPLLRYRLSKLFLVEAE